MKTQHITFELDKVWPVENARVNLKKKNVEVNRCKIVIFY